MPGRAPLFGWVGGKFGRAECVCLDLGHLGNLAVVSISYDSAQGEAWSSCD